MLRNAGEEAFASIIEDAYAGSFPCVEIGGVLTPVEQIPFEKLSGSKVLIKNPADAKIEQGVCLSYKDITDARYDIARLRELTYGRGISLGGKECRCCEAVIRIENNFALIDHHSAKPELFIRSYPMAEPSSATLRAEQLSTG